MERQIDFSNIDAAFSNAIQEKSIPSMRAILQHITPDETGVRHLTNAAQLAAAQQYPEGTVMISAKAQEIFTHPAVMALLEQESMAQTDDYSGFTEGAIPQFEAV